MRRLCVSLLFLAWTLGSEYLSQAQTNYFVEAEISDATPYVGQQVSYLFRLYSNVSRTNRRSVIDPSFNGFWKHSLDTIRQYSVTINSQTYEVTERRVVLFPSYSGEIVIEPTAFIIPDDPLQPGEVLLTEPVTVQVQPLAPGGGVAGFMGVVGHLEMQSVLDKQTINLGEPVTLSLTVRGTGNLEQLSAPELSEAGIWRVYGRPTSYRAEDVDGVLVGEKTFEWLLTPLSTGRQTLPAITVAYFDPDSQIYRSLTTVPVAVDVLPGDEAAQPPAVIASETLSLKPVPTALAMVSGGQGGVFWLLWLIAPAFVALVWRRRREQQRRLRFRAAYLRSEALKQALRLLNTAQKTHTQDRYRLVRQGIVTYFGDKLDIQPESLNDLAIEALLMQAGIALEQRSQVLNCLELADEELYGPFNSHHDDTLIRQAAAALAMVDARWELP